MLTFANVPTVIIVLEVSLFGSKCLDLSVAICDHEVNDQTIRLKYLQRPLETL